MELLTSITMVLGIIVVVALAVPVLFALFERYYAAYANWVWDKMGV